MERVEASRSRRARSPNMRLPVLPLPERTHHPQGACHRNRGTVGRGRGAGQLVPSWCVPFGRRPRKRESRAWAAARGLRPVDQLWPGHGRACLSPSTQTTPWAQVHPVQGRTRSRTSHWRRFASLAEDGSAMACAQGASASAATTSIMPPHATRRTRFTPVRPGRYSRVDFSFVKGVEMAFEELKQRQSVMWGTAPTSA